MDIHIYCTHIWIYISGRRAITYDKADYKSDVSRMTTRLWLSEAWRKLGGSWKTFIRSCTPSLCTTGFHSLATLRTTSLFGKLLEWASSLYYSHSPLYSVDTQWWTTYQSLCRWWRCSLPSITLLRGITIFSKSMALCTFHRRRCWGSFARRQITMPDFVVKIYQMDPKAKYIGFYEFFTPIIVLRDLDLIKAITMKNAEQFSDHRPQLNRKVDLMLGGMLFMLNGDQWKDHRNMLSPTFTSSKIKTMFKLMSECASRFAEHLSNLPEEQRETEMKGLLTKYTNDVIASCVYNVSIDSIKEPNNVFYVYGRICTTLATFKKSMIMLVHRNAPWLAELLQLKIVDSHIAKFFYDQVAETVKIRQRTGDRRSDILQLFIDNNKKREPGKEMTVQDMANHAFSFFFGGFDTVSSQTCIIAHLLAENPDVQERLQQEIDETLKNNNGELTYDAIHEMKYLDAVINETLRLHPIATLIERMCVKDFELPPARNPATNRSPSR